MHSRRSIPVIRWLLAFCALAGIVLVYRRWLHVNTTTVALTLLLLILILAAEWGLRYAVLVAITATVLYNYYFLPPVGTFTISDPQNWLTLLAFLVTAIIASRLSQRARNEAKDARARQRELEILFRLSREFLQSENAGSLLASVPSAVLDVVTAKTAMLYLLERDRLYQAGDTASEIELPHLRQLASTLTDVRNDVSELEIPIRTGVRPKGILVLRGASLSKETALAIGSLISISMERAQALESIAHSEAAKESERLRTLMIDSITHELRTPLTSIKGAATALLGGVGPEQEHELLSIIDEESDRLNNLVSEAVEMAQLDAQQVQMHFAPVRVADVIADARAKCSWVEDTHTLVISVDERERLEMRADPVVFQKVICNLLENAAKYSKAGTPITITALRDGESVAISIADRGVGIGPSEQPLIFERFYRARSQAESTSGTGMGLAISRAIVEAHGGAIRLTSQPGQGSVFTITIPSVATRTAG
jgi:two-component system sensor histidine kinase KdpD